MKDINIYLIFLFNFNLRNFLNYYHMRFLERKYKKNIFNEDYEFFKWVPIKIIFF